MPRRSIKNSKIKAKSHQAHRGAEATRKPGPPKPGKKTEGNPPTEIPRKPEVNKISLAHELGQTPQTIEHAETQEPLIKATDLFTFTKRALSTEAKALLAKVDEGGIPLLMTENLERIAKAHGIEVSREMTPNDIVRRLRNLA